LLTNTFNMSNKEQKEKIFLENNIKVSCQYKPGIAKLKTGSNFFKHENALRYAYEQKYDRHRGAKRPNLNIHDYILGYENTPIPTERDRN